MNIGSHPSWASADLHEYLWFRVHVRVTLCSVAFGWKPFAVLPRLTSELWIRRPEVFKEPLKKKVR